MQPGVTVTKTISEALFEAFCRELDVRFERIHCEENQTPDYDIFSKEHHVVVEVKQFNANSDDERVEKDLRSGKGAFRCKNPSERVRKKITDATPQFKRRAKGICPSLLVLYNNVFSAAYTDSYAIKIGMYGYEEVVLSVPRDFENPIAVRNKNFGPKRKMTPKSCTSISGVAVMFAEGDRPKELRVYHNIYAAMPLPKTVFDSSIVKHFTLEEKRPGEFQDWVLISK
jgi:hypothetical protein